MKKLFLFYSIISFVLCSAIQASDQAQRAGSMVVERYDNRCIKHVDNHVLHSTAYLPINNNKTEIIASRKQAGVYVEDLFGYAVDTRAIQRREAEQRYKLINNQKDTFESISDAFRSCLIRFLHQGQELYLLQFPKLDISENTTASDTNNYVVEYVPYNPPRTAQHGAIQHVEKHNQSRRNAVVIDVRNIVPLQKALPLTVDNFIQHHKNIGADVQSVLQKPINVSIIAHILGSHDHRVYPLALTSEESNPKDTKVNSEIDDVACLSQKLVLPPEQHTKAERGSDDPECARVFGRGYFNKHNDDYVDSEEDD